MFFKTVSPLCGYLTYSSYFATSIPPLCGFIFIVKGAEHQDIGRKSILSERKVQSTETIGDTSDLPGNHFPFEGYQQNATTNSGLYLYYQLMKRKKSLLKFEREV